MENRVSIQNANVSKIATEIEVLKRNLVSLEEDLKDKNMSLKEAQDKLNIYNQAQLFLREVKTKSRVVAIKYIESFINKSLEQLYPGIKIVLQQTQVEENLVLEFTIVENGHTFDLADGYGGGLLATVSTLLLLAFMHFKGIRAPLVLDEKTAFLNGPIHAKMLDLLHELSIALGIVIILVCKPSQEYPENVNIIEVRKIGDVSYVV